MSDFKLFAGETLSEEGQIARFMKVSLVYKCAGFPFRAITKNNSRPMICGKLLKKL